MGPQNETPNAENYKQKVQKPALFVKKKLHFFRHLITWAGPLFCVSPCQIWPYFFGFFGAPFLAETKAAGRARARARADMRQRDRFFFILPAYFNRIWKRRAAIKTHRLNRKRFSKTRKNSFWSFWGPFFRQKKAIIVSVLGTFSITSHWTFGKCDRAAA